MWKLLISWPNEKLGEFDEVLGVRLSLDWRLYNPKLNLENALPWKRRLFPDNVFGVISLALGEDANPFLNEKREYLYL